jgi:hypothetical protein
LHQLLVSNRHPNKLFTKVLHLRGMPRLNLSYPLLIMLLLCSPFLLQLSP